jgi:hypothetical protein
MDYLQGYPSGRATAVTDDDRVCWTRWGRGGQSLQGARLARGRRGALVAPRYTGVRDATARPKILAHVSNPLSIFKENFGVNGLLAVFVRF